MTETYTPTWEQASTRGFITWHCSEEGGGPDVGIELGLGDGRTLYAGELADATLVEHDVDPASGGTGWWLAKHSPGGFEIIGAITDNIVAQEFLEELSAMLSPAENSASSPSEARAGKDSA